MLSSNDGHPVKRVNYATEVIPGKNNETKQTGPQAVFGGVRESGASRAA